MEMNLLIFKNLREKNVNGRLARPRLRGRLF